MTYRRIILPLPRIEGSNSRSHWCVRQRSAKTDRLLAAIEARTLGLIGIIENPVVEIEWYTKTRRMIDCDNALSRCKSYIDGLTDAEWWLDDKQIRKMSIEVFLPGEGCGFTDKVVITARQRLQRLTIDPNVGKGRRTTRRDIIDPDES